MSTSLLSGWRLGNRWWAEPLPLVEIFLVFNIGFLGAEIILAHSINSFAHPGEWVPVVFSAVVTPLLILGLLLTGPWPGPRRDDGPDGKGRRIGRGIGLAVGASSVLVGVTGMIWHLNSDFFQDATIHNLVYTAPFVAPLAYAGLGMALILNRMVPAHTIEWARWVLLLALGGFVGNFVLSLADHAQNGFFVTSEWVSVISAALAVGFLLASTVCYKDRKLIRWGYVVMILQVIVGVVGFGLHIAGNLQRPGSLIDQMLYGTPAFAPLLFADVAILGVLGLWALERALAASGVPAGLGSEELTPAPAGVEVG